MKTKAKLHKMIFADSLVRISKCSYESYSTGLVVRARRVYVFVLILIVVLLRVIRVERVINQWWNRRRRWRVHQALKDVE